MKKKATLWVLLIALLFADVPALAYRTEQLPLRNTTPNISQTYTRFRDVPSTYWGKDGISYVVDKGLFNGTGADTFSPDETMNLAMLCTVLYRFGGSPSADENSLYTDFATRCSELYRNGYAAIQKGEWYSDAMIWALKNEVLSYERKFLMEADAQLALDPNTVLTRTEFCEMLRNYYAYSGGGRVNDYIGYYNTSFKDAGPWTVDDQYTGILWAYTYGIVNGTSDTTLSPNMQITRAQTAAMLERYARQFGMDKPIDPPLPDGFGENGETYSNHMRYMFGATDDKGVETRIIRFINNYRTENGLSELIVNDCLMDAADIRARELLSNDSHIRPDGSSSDTVLKDVGLTEWTLKEEITANSSYWKDLEDAIKGSSEQKNAVLTMDADVKIGVSYMRYRRYPMVVLFAAGRSGDELEEETSAPQSTDSQITALKSDLSQQAAEDRTLIIAGKAFSLGMTADELIDLAGQPDVTVSSSADSTWYIFGTKTYLDFFLADVLDGKVVRLVSGGKAFTYRGSGAGTKGIATPSSYVTLCTDSNDGDVLHAVMLRENITREATFDEDSLRGEAIVNFHMVNAFRVYHGLVPYKWSEAAANAARLHSEDMAKNNYFSHYSLDGRSPWARMEEQGIRWSDFGENISVGSSNGVAAYDSWVNSSGHRDNMLGSYKELGVGAGYDPTSTYRWYMTQVFYILA